MRRAVTRHEQNGRYIFLFGIAMTMLTGIIVLSCDGHAAYAATLADITNRDTSIVIPENTETTCIGEGVYRRCWNRTIKPDPTKCPVGEVLITMRKYGIVGRLCVPE